LTGILCCPFVGDDRMNRNATIAVTVMLGVGLELGFQVLTGRREAWDSAAYWTVGLPIVLVASLLLGYASAGHAWLWTVLLIPSQVAAMMIRSGEVSGLWPLAVVLSAILSTPFVVAAFVGSLFRRRTSDR
jgi:hypothetical protein